MEDGRTLRILFAGAPDAAVRALAPVSAHGLEVTHTTVSDLDELAAALAGDAWDVLLYDDELPSLTGREPFGLARKLAPMTPIILLMRDAGEGAVVDAMRAGAHDFVSWDNLSRLGPAIARAARVGLEGKVGFEVDRGHATEAFAFLREVKDYAIYMIDRTGRVLSWNEGARALKGYEAHEIIGESFTRFFSADDREAGKPASLLRRAAAEGRVEDEAWRIRKDGVRFWADVVITAVHDDSGRLRGFVKVTRDLTDRRRAEEQLRQSEERLRLLVESVKDYAIFMLDPNGNITTWNTGAEHIKQYRAAEIIGKHFSIFYPEEAVAAGHPQYELRVATAVGRYEEEGWRVRKDGERFWANVVITAIIDPDTHELRGFAKVTRDLSERLRMKQQAEVAVADAGRERMRAHDAVAALKMRDEFMSVAAHELRTPLTALQLKLQGVAQKLVKTAAEHNDEGLIKLGARLQGGMRQVERLTGLVERLLDVSRIMQGRLVPELADTDLAALVGQVIEDFREPAVNAGVEFRFHAPSELRGCWDRPRLEQVVINLIGNAIKYGNGQPVDVSVDGDDERARLRIQDRGIGIPADDLERVFLRFERAAPPQHYGGLGLGLYVARSIVDAHGGTIRVQSSTGEGATFIVELPRRPEGVSAAALEPKESRA